MGTVKSIDEAPLTRFVFWTFLYTAGGMFTDGYVFGATSVGMAMAGEDLQLSSVWLGSITAAVLAGVFVGSMVAGRLADTFGRQKIFVLDLILFIGASILQLWIADPMGVFLVRFAIGIAIGAEYAIGSALLAEFAPRKARSALLAGMTAAWTVGYVVAYFVSYGLREAGAAWEVILAAAAVPAALVLVARIGAPESPRWLVSKGRTEEARAVVAKHYGDQYGVEDLTVERDKTVTYSVLFGPKYRTRTAFAAIFWTCQVTVSFAMLLFLPTVFAALKIEGELAANMVINAIMLVGVLLGIYFVQRIARRPLTIWSFVIMAAFMALMAAYEILPSWSILAAFAVYMLVAAASGNLQFVYPPELFPTEVRSSAVGFAAACSRIGSTISTFALPLLLSEVGTSWTFLLLAGISLIGALVSVAWAPETRNLSLVVASGVVPTARAADVEVQGR
jgi:MFS transporter, putative metabolite transport protein